MSLYNELKRRNVFRVAIAYLAGAWLLTEVSGTLFPAFGVPDWGVRFVVIVLALGFVPALIISWAYELTPEGLKREKDVVREASITHFTAKRLDGITIGLILVALAFILGDRFWLSPRHEQPLPAIATVATDSVQTPEPELNAPQYPPNSIAVLPFVNMSDDASNEYFSDGISEELLNLLAKIPELRVISRSSAFSFKGEKADIPTVAKKLNVALVLEGSVRKAGNQVRITAQLIEASSDTHLWSETYDRELENIFEVQDEISTSIVSALKERLGLQLNAVPRMITAANIEAHDAYLRGRYLVVQRTKETIESAVREFEKAIILDPNYALAHAELAIAIILLTRKQYGDLTWTSASEMAVPHAERALATGRPSKSTPTIPSPMSSWPTCSIVTWETTPRPSRCERQHCGLTRCRARLTLTTYGDCLKETDWTSSTLNLKRLPLSTQVSTQYFEVTAWPLAGSGPTWPLAVWMPWKSIQRQG